MIINKIEEFLKKEQKTFTVGELADRLNINPKNISRYIKELKNKNIIETTIIQRGRLRYKGVKIKQTKTGDKKENKDRHEDWEDFIKRLFNTGTIEVNKNKISKNDLRRLEEW